jgi:hypothetical protein
MYQQARITGGTPVSNHPSATDSTSARPSGRTYVPKPPTLDKLSFHLVLRDDVSIVVREDIIKYISSPIYVCRNFSVKWSFRKDIASNLLLFQLENTNSCDTLRIMSTTLKRISSVKEKLPGKVDLWHMVQFRSNL